MKLYLPAQSLGLLDAWLYRHRGVQMLTYLMAVFGAHSLLTLCDSSRAVQSASLCSLSLTEKEIVLTRLAFLQTGRGSSHILTVSYHIRAPITFPLQL